MITEPPDWTRGPGGASNESPLFLAVVRMVADLIRSGAHSLLAGDAEGVASTIVATLAHEHGMTLLTPGEALLPPAWALARVGRMVRGFGENGVAWGTLRRLRPRRGGWVAEISISLSQNQGEDEVLLSALDPMVGWDFLRYVPIVGRMSHLREWVLAGFRPKWPVLGQRLPRFAAKAISGLFRRPARPSPLVWGLTGPRRGISAGSGLAERRLVVAAPTGHFAHHGAAHELRNRFADVKHGPDGADVVAGQVDGDASRGAPLGEERRQLGERGRRGRALPVLACEVVDALVAVVADDAPVEPPSEREVDGLVVYPKKGLCHDGLQLRSALTTPGGARSGRGANPFRLRYCATPRNGSLAAMSWKPSYQRGLT